ncbi:MAG: flagellar hook-basal body complex protein FliE, partial [Pseudomonadota bacterium]
LDNTISREALISQLRSVSAEVSGLPSLEKNHGTFAPLLKDVIKGVSDRQLHATSLTTRFEHGDASVNLSDVMVEIQKARVSFEALSQVRNKFVTAYQQIMSMPL